MLTSTILMAVVGLGAGPQDGPRIDLAALLDELADPAVLSEHPEPFFRTVAAEGEQPYGSAPDAPEGEADRAEHEWLRAEGPGALVHAWVSAPRGTLRVYVDGAGDPAWIAPLAAELPLASPAAGGVELYLPLPYERSCRVTWAPPAVDAGEAGGGTEALRWRLVRREWQPGTPVQSVDAGALAGEAQRLARAAAALSPGQAASQAPPAHGEARQGEITHPFGHRIASTGTGGAAVYAGLSNDAQDSPSAVTELRLVVRDGEARDEADLAALVRSAELILTFDGVDTVRVPLADFFGWSLGPYESRYLSVQGGAEGALLAVRLPMPFRESLFVRVESTRPEPLDLMGYVTIAPYHWTPSTLYFHAERRTAPAGSGEPGRELLSVDRRGQWVGETLTVTGTAAGPVLAALVDGEGEASWAGGRVDGPAASEAARVAALTAVTTRAEGAGSQRLELRVLDRVPFLALLEVQAQVPASASGPLAAVLWYYADLVAPPESERASFPGSGDE